MAEDAPFQVQKEPVLGRDEAPSKLFGFSWGEMGLLFVALIIPLFLSGNKYVVLGCLAGSYLYISKVKAVLPENFFRNACRYALRVWHGRVFYRAGGRDIEWRPPIL